MTRLRAAVTCFAVFLAAAAAAGDVSCPGRDIAVRGAEADVAARTCRAVDAAAAILSECGIAQTRPLTIEIVEVFPDSHGPCLASHDCALDLLRILPPERLDDDRLVSGAFSVLSGAELFDSLIAHEIAHAFLEQTDPSVTGRTAHEYLAYAVQLESLGEDSRAAFLALRGYDDPVTSEMVNPALLLFAPSVFAANAWLYFDGPGERCASVDRIRAGARLFPFWGP